MRAPECSLPDESAWCARELGFAVTEKTPTPTEAKSPVEGLIHALEQKVLEDGAKRKDPRFPVHLTAVLVRADDIGRLVPYATVYISNISMGGVCLFSETRCTEGAEYLLDLESVVGKECLLSMRCMQCKRVLGCTYRIGAAFIQPED